jgi:hypothetical protein
LPSSPLGSHCEQLTDIKMTDTAETQTVSTEGAYSPPIQKALSLGNKEYALKNYEKAVEHYGEASELQ